MSAPSKLVSGFLAGVLSVIVIACVPSRETAFDPVRGEIEARTKQRIRWYQGAREDLEVDAAVARLLAEELTPDAAAQIALLNNRDLQATYEELGVSRAMLVEAGLLRNPVFDAKLLVPVAGDDGKLGLRIQQDFLDIFFIPLRRSVAEAELEATRARVTVRVLDVAFRARSSFQELVAASERQAILERSAEAAALAYEAAQRLREARNNTAFDLLKESTAAQQSRVDLLAAEADVVRLRERLNQELGVFGEQTLWRAPVKLADAPEDAPDLEHVERRAVAQSMELLLARQRVEVAGRALGVADVRGYLPGFEAGAEFEREGPDGRVGPVAALTLPLFNQGQGTIAARDAELRRTLQEYAALGVNVRAAARSIRDRLKLSLEQKRLLRDIVLPAQQRLVEEALLQHNAMAIGVFELLDAKRAELAAETAYVEAKRDAWLARIELDQLLSGSLPRGLEAAGVLQASTREGSREVLRDHAP